MLDIERIKKTKIPDIAPVYGGVRGRTMSSKHQLYAWPAIVEAGVKRVIDLRDADKSDRLPKLCAEYGLEYFHYPIDSTYKTITEMVNRFPEFCELIDQGDFYIACAMGLHRTDIALCTYWVFYASDKGVAPPAIRGYRQEDGHNTNKIMRVLNAFYQCKSEMDGSPPMSIEVFKERKAVITANGLLNAMHQSIPLKTGICRAYIEWYLIQIGKKLPEYHDCWIGDVPELNARRAPGNTCMSALEAIYRGKEPDNNSKGCGGVMRVAPIPLYGVVERCMSVGEVDRLAAEAAEITHKHPLGFIPAALAAHVIYCLSLDEAPTRESFERYILEGMKAMEMLFPSYPSDMKYMGELAEKAIALAGNGSLDLENITCLGEGWTGDETLAIALYCALKHFDNFEEAMIAAVNHGGDSDSTGAVCGNILGAAIGYEAIPQFFKDDLEMHDLILHMADDLYCGEITKMNK